MRLTPRAGDEWPAHHHAQGSRGEPHASWPPKLRLQGQRSWSPKGALGRERECCTGSQSVGDAWGAAGGGWRQGCCARRTHRDGRAGPRRPTGLRPPLGCDGAAGRTHAQRGRAWAFVVSLVHYRLTFSDTDILVGPGHGESGLPGKTQCEGGAGGRPHTQPRPRPGEERGRRRAPDSRRSFPCFEWPALLQVRLVWQARRGRPSHVTATETRDMLSQLSPRLGLPRCSWGCRSPVFCHRPLETGAGPPSLRGLEGAPGRRSAPPREPHAPSLLLVTAWRLPSRQPLLKA